MGVKRLDEYLRQLGKAVREGGVDVEALLRRLVDEIASSLRCECNCASQDAGLNLKGLEEKVSELLERLSRLEERITSLEETVARLEASRGLSEKDVKMMAEAIAEALSKVGLQVKSQGQKQEPRWLREIERRINERGYVLLSELSPSIREEVNLTILGEKGFVVEKVAGDIIVASVDGIRRLADMLSRIRSSDEYEAELKLAEYGRLFRLLRSEGLVYYNAARKGWVVKAFKSILSS